MKKETLIGTSSDKHVNILAEALSLIDPELPRGDWEEVSKRIEGRYGLFTGDIFYSYADIPDEGIQFLKVLGDTIMALRQHEKED